MLEYEHALMNMRSIANFYKKAYYKSQVYEPFFKYINKILHKFKEIQDIISHYEEKKFEIDQLHAEIQFYQKENVELNIKENEKVKKNSIPELVGKEEVEESKSSSLLEKEIPSRKVSKGREFLNIQNEAKKERKS